jgi:hypothetical protein
MTYTELSQTIQSYVESTEQLFVENIPVFVQQAEERIYNTVQLPSLRKNVTGAFSTSNQYLSLPNDYLSTFSMAVIKPNGEYEYLLNKDVNFIRQAYPNPTDEGVPKYYALFGPQYTNNNELSFIVGPTPDANYNVEMHYFYYPPTIVQGVISTTESIVSGSAYSAGTYLGVNLTGGNGTSAVADIVVSGGGVTSVVIRNGGSLYVQGDILSAPTSAIGNTGSGFSVNVATEAILFQKGEQDLVAYYEKQFQDALQQLNRLGTGLERGDAYRDGQAKIKVNP